MSDGPTVGVVGAGAERIVAAVEAAGGDAVVGPAGQVPAGCESVVAVGEAAVLAAARSSPDCPVLPVAAGRGVRSVPLDRVEAAAVDLVDGDYDCERHALPEARVADATSASVLFDATLVTGEPADISEFSVRTAGERVATFRADGVVVATPAGSPGYARRAGGPVVPPATNGVVVVPIAPFATDAEHWVVPPDGVRVSVERDEAPVSLVADGRVAGPVPAGRSVRLTAADSVAFAVVDASASRFEAN